jgi:hypothetical protein
MLQPRHHRVVAALRQRRIAKHEQAIELGRVSMA